MAAVIEVHCRTHQYVNKVVGAGVQWLWRFSGISIHLKRPSAPPQLCYLFCSFWHIFCCSNPRRRDGRRRSRVFKMCDDGNCNFCTFPFLFAWRRASWSYRPPLVADDSVAGWKCLLGSDALPSSSYFILWRVVNLLITSKCHCEYYRQTRLQKTTPNKIFHLEFEKLFD